MNDDHITRVRNHAFALWEEEGRPDGKHEEHWQRALAAVDAESQPAPKKAPAKSRTRTASADAGATRAPRKTAGPRDKSPAKPAKPRTAPKS